MRAPRIFTLAYLIGSLPNAYLLTRWFSGGDIRRMGSQNVGATNVSTNVGWLPGLLTLAGDIGKGYLAAVVGELSPDPAVRSLTPAFAIAGHNWPVWLRFHGGGGLATFIGACLRLTGVSLPMFALALWGLLYFAGLGHDRSAALACIALPCLALVIGQPAQIMTFIASSSLVVFLRRLQSISEGARRQWSEEKPRGIRAERPGAIDESR